MTLRSAVRHVAFLRLIQTGSPLSAADVAADLDAAAGAVEAIFDDLGRQGRARSDGAGRVTGVAGLSVVPDRHLIEVGSRRLWTWCAYDALGILGALSADGRCVSRSPLSGAIIQVRFRRGRPE